MPKPPYKPAKILPGIKYAPQTGDERRGGGDYEYNNRANSYNANPDYAQQYGGGGGMPPAQEPEYGPKASGYVQSPQFLQGRAAGAMGALPNQEQDILAWYSQAQAQGGGGGNPSPLQYPAFGPLSTGYVQNPAFLKAQGQAETVAGGAPQYIIDAFRDYYQKNPNGAEIDYPNRTGGVQYNPAGSMDDRRPESRTAPTDPQATDIARTQDAVTKNQTLTQQAKDTGNDKELARLQAEWERIAPKAQKYGISAERLVNSYMQPGNDAAETSLDRALGRAIADDTWAGAATIAFGRPPNQLEWDEHWRAMNKGGRDPLEGHPAAIQAIQAKMKEIEQENQNDAFGKYQDWLANQ